jgi:LacI family transcriptional regulator
VTVRDVARLAGVSHGTVSNVLNRPDRVTQKTREKVEEAMERLSFVPNEAARQLSGGRSRLIGLVLLDLENPFFLEVARGVEDAATNAGYVVMLFNSAGAAEREERALEALREHRVSGVLLSPVSRMAGGVPRLRAQGSHVVFLDRRAPRADFCSVAVDDHHGAVTAMAHLLSNGHTRIAFVSGPSHLRQHQARLRGVHSAAASAGLNPSDVTVFREEMSVAGGERAGHRLLAAAGQFTAVVCANDQLAFGV